MKKQSEIYRDQDAYSRMILNELNLLRDQKETDLKVLQAKDQYIAMLEERIERMKGAMYLMFFLSSLGILLILENILHPWLKTL
jgi:hypothetical protein